MQIDLAPLSVLGRARHRQPDGITIYPVERFGNQLFTYAAGLSQARRLGCPLHASLGFYGPYKPQRNYSFSYGLDVFDNGIEPASAPDVDRPIFRGLPPSATGRVLTQTVGRRTGSLVGGVFIERGFTYDPSIEEIPVGTTLLGFFQSWRYFERVADEIRTRMLALREPSPWYQEMCRTITPGDGSIVLNVRRGDYVLAETQAYQGLARRSYYERALELVRRLGATGAVYLMTDSMDDVLEEFAGMAQLTPIRPPGGTQPMEMLGVLARADALVAGNSTFSWWGGFLGERPGRPVVAPRPWFTVSHLDTRDLLLPGWITLDREH